MCAEESVCQNGQCLTCKTPRLRHLLIFLYCLSSVLFPLSFMPRRMLRRGLGDLQFFTEEWVSCKRGMDRDEHCLQNTTAKGTSADSSCLCARGITISNTATPLVATRLMHYMQRELQLPVQRMRHWISLTLAQRSRKRKRCQPLEDLGLLQSTESACKVARKGGLKALGVRSDKPC